MSPRRAALPSTRRASDTTSSERPFAQRTSATEKSSSREAKLLFGLRAPLATGAADEPSCQQGEYKVALPQLRFAHDDDARGVGGVCHERYFLSDGLLEAMLLSEFQLMVPDFCSAEP